VVTLGFECKVFLGLRRLNFPQEEHFMGPDLPKNIGHFKRVDLLLIKKRCDDVVLGLVKRVKYISSG
jgi:hypothetical protein